MTQHIDEIRDYLQSNNGYINEYAISHIDIDFFTRICKCFTPDEVDIIMRRIALFIESQLSSRARIWKLDNDDEFIIAARNCNKSELAKILNTVKQHFRKQKFAETCNQQYSNIPMTFSAGVASYPIDGDDVDMILRKAIVGQFLAKAYRRNRIVEAPDDGRAGCNRILYKDNLKVDVILGNYGEIGHINKSIHVSKARLWEPQAIDVDDIGNVYIADQNNNSIILFDGEFARRIAGTGKFGYSGDGGDGLSALLNKPTGLTVFNHYLYITDTGNDVVRVLDINSNIISTYAGNGCAGYSCDRDSATKASLNKPGGIVADRDGNIYINDIANNVIRKVDTYGEISTFAGTGKYGYDGDGGPASHASFAEIYGMGINRNTGQIFIADYYNHCIRMIDIKSGIISKVVGTGEEGYSGDGDDALKAKLNRPVAVCVDNNCNLYIAESGNHCIRFYHAKSKRLFTLVGDGVAGTGRPGDVGSFRLANPNGVAIGGNGILYILDGANNRICTITLGGK